MRDLLKPFIIPSVGIMLLLLLVVLYIGLTTLFPNKSHDIFQEAFYNNLSITCNDLTTIRNVIPVTKYKITDCEVNYAKN